MRTFLLKNTSFGIGQTMIISGVINPNATRFAVNIGPNEEDIALHINPRFKYYSDVKTVVCNSCQGGKWGPELRQGGFPFCQGMNFKMIITFNPTEFLVTLSDGSNILFPNRIGAEQYSVISVDGDARVTGFEIQ